MMLVVEEEERRGSLEEFIFQEIQTLGGLVRAEEL
jgi:hypothetical protein